MRHFYQTTILCWCPNTPMTRAFFLASKRYTFGGIFYVRLQKQKCSYFRCLSFLTTYSTTARLSSCASFLPVLDGMMVKTPFLVLFSLC